MRKRKYFGDDCMKRHVEEEIVSQYKKTREKYLELDKIIIEKIMHIIQVEHLFVMDVAHRVKEVESLKGKLLRKQGKYNSLSQITDLCGVRIICYFVDTVEQIAKELERVFDVDYENSIDKSANLQATQFGYLSIHYICSLKKEEQYPQELTDVRFEIQMRTVLQHAWAEIEHDLGYKSEFGVPREIRREFSRIAGLLEVADEQFVNLRKNTKKYVENVKIKIANSEADDLMINQVTLPEFLSSNHKFLERMESFKEETHVEFVSSNTEKYLRLFEYMGINKLGELSAILMKNEKLMAKLIMEQIQEMELDFLTYSMLLRNLCIAELIIARYTNDRIRKFSKIYYTDNRLANKLADFVIKEKNDYWYRNLSGENQV